jgi:glycosyltransferase involved in cell wall biosynthesis
VWIGRPENLISLELVRPALAGLARQLPELRLRVVCSHFPQWSELEIEAVPWSVDSEVEALTTADVGIMPLADDAWSRGKCGFKLLQYMAASLPCVASPVGANTSVVEHGVTGSLAASADEWQSALHRLLTDRALRQKMGAAGRERAENHYSMHTYCSRYRELLTELGSRHRRRRHAGAGC